MKHAPRARFLQLASRRDQVVDEGGREDLIGRGFNRLSDGEVARQFLQISAFACVSGQDLSASYDQMVARQAFQALLRLELLSAIFRLRIWAAAFVPVSARSVEDVVSRREDRLDALLRERGEQAKRPVDVHRTAPSLFPLAHRDVGDRGQDYPLRVS